MKPERIIFYVYAENAEEAAALQAALHDFVADHYERGLLVTAERLTDVLRRYGNSPLVSNFLKNG